MVWVWVALAIVLLIAEITTGTFYFLAFAVSALITAILTWLWIDHFWTQILIMAVCSVAAMFIVPAVLQRTIRKSEGFTNATEQIIGTNATVTRDITPAQNGTIKLPTGAEWTAKSQVTLQAGSIVTVTGLDGTIAIVVPLAP